MAKRYRGGFDCRERPDVVEASPGICYPLVRVGSEDGVGSAEDFGDDRRQRQSAIETLAVELPEPLVWLFPVSNEYDRLNSVLAPCCGTAEQQQR